ncbi:MAG: homoserine kinase [Nanoarchaeota archaeon]|nr:homoserine kinase [Nanoarchaeota archaeon]
MAVKTNFTKKVFQEILDNYDIGDFKESKPFKAGYVQTNILIKTTKGKFVLRYYENRTKKRVDFEAKLLKFLSEKKYPIAKPIENKKHQFIGIFDKKPFIIFEYISGRHLKNLNNIQFKELVHKLALLHKLTKNYDVNNYIHKEPRSKDFCIKATKEEKKRFEDKDKGKFRYNIIKSQLDTINFPTNLTKSIVHGDFDKSNVKFHNNEISGILDFDDSHYGYRIHDIGILILYWARFYTNKMDFSIAKKIVNSYEEISPLTKTEKEHLFDAFKFAALMIMSWLMYDKWKGKDLFKILSNALDEIDVIGRKKFYEKLFK